MASKQRLLDRLDKLFPERLTLSPEEVAGLLYGKPTQAVIEAVRGKCRSGKIPAKKLGKSRQDPWLITVDDLAEVLADVEQHPATNTPTQKHPVSPHKGKRSRPLVNPGVRAFLSFWIDTARVAGLDRVSVELQADLNEIEAIRRKRKARRTAQKIKQVIPDKKDKTRRVF